MRVGVLVLLSSGSASAVVEGTATPTYPLIVVVGETGVPIELTIINTSTPPDNTSETDVVSIFHTPSCAGHVNPACSAADADLGVFQVNGPVTGRAGTACAGIVFTVGAPNPTTGELQFAPSALVTLGPADNSGGPSTCIIDFTVDVLAVPATDSNPSVNGVQTEPLGRVLLQGGSGTGFAEVTFCSDAVPGAACPCPNANPRLGSATKCTALSLAKLRQGAGGVSMSGITRATGNVCIGQGGRLEASGKTDITGSILLDPGPPPATCHSKSSNVECANAVVTDLDAQIDGCDNASTTAAARTCTIGDYKESLTQLVRKHGGGPLESLELTRKGDAGPTVCRKAGGSPLEYTMKGDAGVNVLCVNAVDLAGNTVITLTGTPTTTFIINVSDGGPFMLSCGSKIKAGEPVRPSDVLYNVIGNGPQVSLSGSAEIDGTIVAIDRDISLSRGVVNGQLCGGRKIKLSSAVVQCETP